MIPFLPLGLRARLIGVDFTEEDFVFMKAESRDGQYAATLGGELVWPAITSR